MVSLMVSKKLVLSVFILFCCSIILVGEVERENDTPFGVSLNHPSERFGGYSITAGWQWYTGPFRTHLVTDGAWEYSPTLDIQLYAFPFRLWGIGASIGGAGVAHPQSQPIEGVISYLGIQSVFRFPSKSHGLYITTGVGFLNPGMLLSWYASAYWELSWELYVDLSSRFSLKGGMRYRDSFFNSIIIHKMYDSITMPDKIESIGITFGLVTHW